jgi:2-polyprenyl-3-methyl-5-hydroxy-6-metoxy-1,4-benzoquinol methylase
MGKLVVIVRHFLHPFNPRWLFKTETINATQFLASWEPRWNKVADPTNEEVYQRLSQLIEKNVAEIGAGYGRVATYLADKGLVVYPIEPNAILVDKIISRSDECGGGGQNPNLRKSWLTPALTC